MSNRASAPRLYKLQTAWTAATTLYHDAVRSLLWASLCCLNPLFETSTHAYVVGCLRNVSGPSRAREEDGRLAGARVCGLAVLIFGLEKFGNDPHWTKMFREIGWGL